MIFSEEPYAIFTSFSSFWFWFAVIGLCFIVDDLYDSFGDKRFDCFFFNFDALELEKFVR